MELFKYAEISYYKIPTYSKEKGHNKSDSFEL